MNYASSIQWKRSFNENKVLKEKKIEDDIGSLLVIFFLDYYHQSVLFSFSVIEV